MLQLRAVPDDDQLPAQELAGIDQDVCALIRDQSSNGQVVVFMGVSQETTVSNDRRMDHGAFSPVILLDSPGDIIRIGQKMVNPLRRGVVPIAYVVRRQPE